MCKGEGREFSNSHGLARSGFLGHVISETFTKRFEQLTQMRVLVLSWSGIPWHTQTQLKLVVTLEGARVCHYYERGQPWTECFGSNRLLTCFIQKLSECFGR